MAKKITIYSFHYNRPDFVKLQHEAFRHFLKEFSEVRFVVVNNATDNSLKQEIIRTSSECGFDIITTNIAPTPGLPGLHHAYAMNKIWQEHASKVGGYVIFMDGDLFPIKQFSVRHYMDYGSWIVAGAKQNRAGIYEYLTPILLIMDTDQMPDKQSINWVGVHVDGVALDTGGGFYDYLNNHSEIKKKTKSMKFTWHIKSANNNLDVLPSYIKTIYTDDFVFEMFTDSFLHYCRSSNWDGMPSDYHQAKTLVLKEFIEKTMDGSIIMEDYEQPKLPTEYFGWRQ